MSPTCSQPAAQGVSGGLRLSLKSSSEEAAAHPSPSPLPVAEETRPRLASWFPETPAVQEDYETEGDGSESQVSTITYERHESLMSVTSSPISIADKKRRSSTLNDAPGFKTTQKKLSEWNAEQVAEWAALTPLPLEVAEMLRAHAITGPVLEVLSEDDMVTIGLHKLGWRRQLDLSRQELLEQLESSATSEPQSSDPIEIHSDPCTPKSTATATSSPFGIRPACSPQNGAGRLPKTSKNAEQHASLRESRNGGRLAESIEGSPVASAIGRALDAGGDTFSVSRQPTIHVPPVPPVPPVQSPSRSISSSPPRAGAPCSHSMPLPTVPLLSSRPPRVSVTPLGRARATIGSPASHVARFGGVVRMPSESPVRTAPAQPSAPRRSLSPPPYSGKDASYGSLTPPRASVAVHSVRREQDAGYGSLTPPQGSLTPLRPPGKGGSAAAPSTSIAVRRSPEDAGYGSLTPPRGSLTPPVLRSLGQSASAAASSAPIGARRSGEATPIAPSTECPVTPKPSPQLHSSALPTTLPRFGSTLRLTAPPGFVFRSMPVPIDEESLPQSLVAGIGGRAILPIPEGATSALSGPVLTLVLFPSLSGSLLGGVVYGFEVRVDNPHVRPLPKDNRWILQSLVHVQVFGAISGQIEEVERAVHWADAEGFVLEGSVPQFEVLPSSTLPLHPQNILQVTFMLSLPLPRATDPGPGEVWSARDRASRVVLIPPEGFLFPPQCEADATVEGYQAYDPVSAAMAYFETKSLPPPYDCVGSSLGSRSNATFVLLPTDDPHSGMLVQDQLYRIKIVVRNPLFNPREAGNEPWRLITHFAESTRSTLRLHEAVIDPFPISGLTAAVHPSSVEPAVYQMVNVTFLPRESTVSRLAAILLVAPRGVELSCVGLLPGTVGGGQGEFGWIEAERIACTESDSPFQSGDLCALPDVPWPRGMWTLCLKFPRQPPYPRSAHSDATTGSVMSTATTSLAPGASTDGVEQHLRSLWFSVGAMNPPYLPTDNVWALVLLSAPSHDVAKAATSASGRLIDVGQMAGYALIKGQDEAERRAMSKETVVRGQTRRRDRA